MNDCGVPQARRTAERYTATLRATYIEAHGIKFFTLESNTTRPVIYHVTSLYTQAVQENFPGRLRQRERHFSYLF